MANQVYESMTYWANRYSWYNIRVWNNEKEWTFGPNEQIVKTLDDMVLNPTCQPKDISINLYNKFPTISAIEILDCRTKCGGLYYPDWN